MSDAPEAREAESPKVQAEPEFVVVTESETQVVEALKKQSLDLAHLPSVNNKSLIAVRLSPDKTPASIKNADLANPEVAAIVAIAKAQLVLDTIDLAGVSSLADEIVAYKSIAALSPGSSLGALSVTPNETLSAACRAFYGSEALRYVTLLSGATLSLFTVTAISAYGSLFYQHPLPWLSFLQPLALAVFVFAVGGAVDSPDQLDTAQPSQSSQNTPKTPKTPKRRPSKFAQLVYMLSALAGMILYLGAFLAIVLVETCALNLASRSVLVVHFAAVTTLLSLSYIFWSGTIEWWSSKEGYESRDALRVVKSQRKFFMTLYFQLAFLLVGLVFVPLDGTKLAALEQPRQRLVDHIFDHIPAGYRLTPDLMASQVLAFVDWGQLIVVGLVPLLAFEGDLYELFTGLVSPTIAPLERPVDEARRRVALEKMDIESDYALATAAIVNIFVADSKRFFSLAVAAAWLSLLVRALPQRLSLASSLGPKDAARRWYGNLIVALGVTAVVAARFYAFGNARAIAAAAITPVLDTPLRYIMPATIGGYLLPYVIQNVVRYTPEPKVNDISEAADIAWS